MEDHCNASLRSQVRIFEIDVAKSPAKPVVSLHPPTSTLATAVAWSYFGLIVLAIAIFYLQGSWTVIAGQEMSWPKTTFTVVNFATLTGFQTTTNYSTDLKLPGQFLALLLTVGGILYSLIVSGTACVRILRLPYTDRQVGFFCLVITAVAMLGGSSLLIRSDQSLLASVFQAASAFGNSGSWLGADPHLSDWQSWVVLMPLAIIGGLGLPVLIELIWPKPDHPISKHSQFTLAWSAGVLLVGTLLLLVLNLPKSVTDISDLRMPFLHAVSGSIESRGAAIPVYNASEFSRHAQRILMILMLIGAGTAGTAGGLKVTTLFVLYRGTRESLASRPAGRLFGIAMTWLAILIGLFVLCYINLLRTVPDLDADRLLMLSISAATNAGLSHDRVSMANAGYSALAITMLLGRIIPPMILWWISQSTRDADVCVA